MNQIGTFFAWVLGIIALIFIAAAYGLVWSYKFSVLEFFPAAKSEHKITLKNYDAYQIIVREYRKGSAGKHKLSYFDVVDHRVVHKLHGDYMIRSDGRNAFIINQSDKSAFDAGEDVLKYHIGEGYKNCTKNSTCKVNPSVEYKYAFSTKDKEGNVRTSQPYEYAIKY